MIKEIPILFSTPMVQAILEGRKSHTRRILKEKHVLYSLDVNKVIPEYFKDGDGGWCPYGKPGDILWVRETWRPDLEGHDVNDYIEKIRYAADGAKMTVKWVKDYNDYRNRPGIHMNKEYARIWLKVKSIRVERLQDISEEDALAEGIEPVNTNADTRPEYRDYMGNELRRIGETKPWGLTAFGSFRSLWEKINGADSWLANPLVWVVSFTVVSTDGKPSPLTEKVEQ